MCIKSGEAGGGRGRGRGFKILSSVISFTVMVGPPVGMPNKSMSFRPMEFICDKGSQDASM